MLRGGGGGILKALLAAEFLFLTEFSSFLQVTTTTIKA